MVSLLTGSRVGTPWYCAYVRLTIGASAAKIEGEKKQMYEMNFMKGHIFQVRSGNRELVFSPIYTTWSQLYKIRIIEGY